MSRKSGYRLDRKSTRLNSSHVENSYAVFCLKKKRGATVACPPPVNRLPRRRIVRGHQRAACLAPAVGHHGSCHWQALATFSLFFFFFNDTATPEIYTLSLHDALPISGTAATRFRKKSPATKSSPRAAIRNFSTTRRSTASSPPFPITGTKMLSSMR